MAPTVDWRIKIERFAQRERRGPAFCAAGKCYPRSKMSDEQPKDANAQEDLPAVTVEGELQAVTAERDKLAAEKAELNDRLLRKQAEFDNFRRRTERDRYDFLQFAGME